MEFLYLTVTIFAIALQSVVRKSFNRKVKDGGVFIFSSVSVLSAALFFLFSAGQPLNFTVEMIPYSIGFGLTYCVAVIFSFLSIREGPLSLTSLITSFSLLIPALFGILFFNEPISIFLFIGLAFLIASLILINLKNEECKITLKWLIFVSITFLSNGMCSVVQNSYVKLGMGNKNEFMVIALGIAFLILIVLSLFTEKEKFPSSLKGGWIYMTSCGIANGVANLFVILLSAIMSASLMFPLISAGGIIVTSLISIFYYKEKLTPTQYVGMVLGIAATVLLNL